jgi:hypothetical protein
LENIRALHRRAVLEPEVLGKAIEEVRILLAATPEDMVAIAYQGSLIALRARGEKLPWNKLARLNEGLALMGSAVDGLAKARGHAPYPADLEIRMIRGMTTAMIPAMFGHARTAREDLRLVVDHPAFATLETSDRAGAMAWLAVALHRAGETTRAEGSMLDARAADADLADAIWSQK